MANPAAPFWLNAIDSQRLILDAKVGGETVNDMVNRSLTWSREQVAKVGEFNRSAQWAFEQLESWYTEITADKIASTQALIDAVDAFLSDVYRMGIYVFATRPDYGGYEYLKSAIADSLENQEDPNRPLFGEGSSMGGALILFSGTAVEMFFMYALLAFLRQGNMDAGAFLRMFADRVFAFSKLIEDAQQAMLESAQDMNETYHEFANRWGNSSVVKLAGGIKDLVAPDPGVETLKLKYQDSVQLCQKLEQKNVRFRLVKKGPLKWDAYFSPDSGWVKVVDELGGEGIVEAFADDLEGKTVKRFIIQAEANFDPFKSRNRAMDVNLDEPFDRWQQVFRLSGLWPGATKFVTETHNTLTAVNAGITETDRLIKDSIAATSDTLSRILDRVENFGDNVVDALESAIYDLTNLIKVSVLVIPPQAGGTHQFLYALEQHLANDVANAPPMSDGAFTGAMLLTAGIPIDVNDPAATPVWTALNDALKSFGITLQQ